WGQTRWPRFAPWFWALTWVIHHCRQARVLVTFLHAAGPETFSAIRAVSLRDVHLLPSATRVRHARRLRPLRPRSGANAPALRSVRLQTCSHARARAFAIKRAAAWASGGRFALLEVILCQAFGGPS